MKAPLAAPPLRDSAGRLPTRLLLASAICVSAPQHLGLGNQGSNRPQDRAGETASRIRLSKVAFSLQFPIIETL